MEHVDDLYVIVIRMILYQLGPGHFALIRFENNKSRWSDPKTSFYVLVLLYVSNSFDIQNQFLGTVSVCDKA